MTAHCRVLGLVLCCVLVVVSSTTGRAEIGGFDDPTKTEWRPLGPWQFVSIVEDPDPYGLVWEVHSAPSPGYEVLNAAGHANGDGPPSLAYNPFSELPIVAWALNSSRSIRRGLQRPYTRWMVQSGRTCRFFR